MRVDVTRLGNTKDDKVFARYASEEVAVVLSEKGITVLTDDESYEVGPNVTMGTKHFRRNVVFDPDGRFFKLRNIPSKFLADAARFIAALPFTVRVTPLYARKKLNLYARSVIQGSIWKDPFNTIHAATPIWSKGDLRGDSVIVGVGDTGANRKNCYLAGEDKFKYYNTEYGNDEDEDGHGTHVVGSLAGYFRLMRAREDGMATSAQIAFFDLAYTDENGEIVMAATPNMDSAYYQVAYDAGARIHSDSWGYDVFEYDAETKEIDQYARDTPDFLPFLPQVTVATMVWFDYDASGRKKYALYRSVEIPKILGCIHTARLGILQRKYCQRIAPLFVPLFAFENHFTTSRRFRTGLGQHFKRVCNCGSFCYPCKARRGMLSSE